MEGEFYIYVALVIIKYPQFLRDHGVDIQKKFDTKSVNVEEGIEKG
jgi:hypothetical protein